MLSKTVLKNYNKAIKSNSYYIMGKCLSAFQMLILHRI